MMKELLAGLEIMAAQEKKRAEKENGATFHSPHEAYGVIAEELMEAKSEVTCLDVAGNSLLKVIHRNDPKLYRCTLQQLRNAAMNAAAELVQVVAMCDKALGNIDAPVDPAGLSDLARRNAERYKVYAQRENGGRENEIWR